MPTEDPRTILPPDLADRAELSLDLRWTGSPTLARTWRAIDPDTWERTRNPWLVLQEAPCERVRASEDLLRRIEQRRRDLAEPTWFDALRRRDERAASLRRVAYFSMEYGLSEALPIYSGGLGVLAGDHLKAASDLGVPLVGVGLLYQQGYFRQVLADDGTQLEAYPFNDPGTLPVEPVRGADGARLEIRLDLPGRQLRLHAWTVRVGRGRLLLLDTNHPLNAPWDRGITARLYTSAGEQRLLQEIVLAIGGWRLLLALGLEPDVCHLNEGHAAFVVWARAATIAERHGLSFDEALVATRAGNVFTTHTPVDAAFDRFDPRLMAPYLDTVSRPTWQPAHRLLAMGRRDPRDHREPFNMALLALRGSGRVNAVSRLHARVSRSLFTPAFPGRPAPDLPIEAVTNGVDVPSWRSPVADELWKDVAGERWHADLPKAAAALAEVPAARLWEFRTRARRQLVDSIRRRGARQVREHGGDEGQVEAARRLLHPDALTLGFARRFTAYKRPTLLFRDPGRLARLLRGGGHGRPVQLVIAGKAHPHDEEGRRMVAEVARFAARPDVRGLVVFLEDHDMALGQELAGGIDVWINTPVRGMEACGTSGMKVLANGGLNLSVLDGWWDEVDDPATAADETLACGWSLGDRRHPPAPDAELAGELYRLLESAIVPEFHDRDAEGVPRRWVERIRASMTTLVPRFSAQRMVEEYVRDAYLPAADAVRARIADEARRARGIAAWRRRIEDGFPAVRFGPRRVERVAKGGPHGEGGWRIEVEADLDGLAPDDVRAELYAEPVPGDERVIRIPMSPRPVEDGDSMHRWTAVAPGHRPAEHFTARIEPFHADAIAVLEAPEVRWQG